MLSLTSCPKRNKTDGSHTNRPFCVTRRRKQQKNREATLPNLIFFCFFSSKKKRRRPFFLLERKERGRFLFLKKRNKRHCGIVDLSEKRCFPARPARNEKTDGSHTNRPFCMPRWRKRQKNREATLPNLIFFCFFSSKKKRRRTFFLLERKERGRFLFLKKRNKRHCGIVDQSEKRCFPARPARNEKKRTVRM